MPLMPPWQPSCVSVFLVLTATRSGEARGARWSEVNLDAKEWRIPASRMKARVEHSIPLPVAAVTTFGASTHTAG